MPKTLACLAAFALSACYAQLEDSSVAVTKPLCGGSQPDCIPGGGFPVQTLQLDGKNTLTVPLGDQDFFRPETELGPTRLVSHLVLKQTILEMKTQGCDFKGFTHVAILSAPRESTGPTDDPCAAPAVCPALAEYDQATDGVADQKLVFKGNGSDLIAVIDQVKHQLVLEIQASGTTPGNASIPRWGADVTLDMALSARANFP